jgi:hypothetical protein
MPPKSTTRVPFDAADKPARKSYFEKIKETAPIVTSVATLLLSFVSFRFVQIQEREKTSQEREKTNLAILEARQRALVAAVEPDPKKRDVAASTLALYGTELALPAIRTLLIGSLDTSTIREFGVLAVRRRMQAGNDESRHALLEELFQEARSDVSDLRQGAYAAIEKIVGQMTAAEKKRVLQLLNERFGMGTRATEQDEQALQKACAILNSFEFAQTRSALRNIAKTRAVAQAISS